MIYLLYLDDLRQGEHWRQISVGLAWLRRAQAGYTGLVSGSLFLGRQRRSGFPWFLSHADLDECYDMNVTKYDYYL
jgi:hypothetical protein